MSVHKIAKKYRFIFSAIAFLFLNGVSADSAAVPSGPNPYMPSPVENIVHEFTGKIQSMDIENNSFTVVMPDIDTGEDIVRIVEYTDSTESSYGTAFFINDKLAYETDLLELVGSQPIMILFNGVLQEDTDPVHIENTRFVYVLTEIDN